MNINFKGKRTIGNASKGINVEKLVIGLKKLKVKIVEKRKDFKKRKEKKEERKRKAPQSCKSPT